MPTYTIILCIFFVFIIFYMLLEKNKMLVLIWRSDFRVFFDVNSHVLEFNGWTQQWNVFMTIVIEKSSLLMIAATNLFQASASDSQVIRIFWVFSMVEGDLTLFREEKYEKEQWSGFEYFETLRL